jgi:hypothetical protein
MSVFWPTCCVAFLEALTFLSATAKLISVNLER